MAVAHRLQLTEKALGLKQGHFADRVGLARNAYNQFRKGERYLPIRPALQIAERAGVTLDWIYIGSMAGLPHDLAVKLLALRDETEGKA